MLEIETTYEGIQGADRSIILTANAGDHVRVSARVKLGDEELLSGTFDTAGGRLELSLGPLIREGLRASGLATGTVSVALSAGEDTAWAGIAVSYATIPEGLLWLNSRAVFAGRPGDIHKLYYPVSGTHGISVAAMQVEIPEGPGLRAHPSIRGVYTYTYGSGATLIALSYRNRWNLPEQLIMPAERSLDVKRESSTARIGGALLEYDVTGVSELKLKAGLVTPEHRRSAEELLHSADVRISDGDMRHWDDHRRAVIAEGSLNWTQTLPEEAELDITVRHGEAGPMTEADIPYLRTHSNQYNQTYD